jgi:hypothetical protein
MGTLFNQQPRGEHLLSHVYYIRQVLKDDFGVDPYEATPGQWMAACRVVEVASKLQTADVFDEQLAGFGELIREFINATAEK